MVALKTNNLTWTVAMNQQASNHWRGKICFSSPKSLIFRELSLFDLTGSFLKTATCRACLYFILLRVCSGWIAFPLGHLLKTISGNCLISQLLEAALTVGVNKKLNQYIEKEKLGNEMVRAFFKKFWHIPGNLEGHMPSRVVNVPRKIMRRP